MEVKGPLQIERLGREFDVVAGNDDQAHCWRLKGGAVRQTTAQKQDGGSQEAVNGKRTHRDEPLP